MIRTWLSIVALAGFIASQPIVVGAVQGKGGPRSAAKPALTAALNINTASASDFQTLPGIGAKTAARIVEYRQKNGPFKKIEELMNVRGVGEKNFLKLKPQISVTIAKAEPDHPRQ